MVQMHFFNHSLCFVFICDEGKHNSPMLVSFLW